MKINSCGCIGTGRQIGRVISMLALAFIIIGCGGGGEKPDAGASVKRFNDAILELRQNDGFLSKEDIDSLKKQALGYNRFAKWKDADGEIIMDSLANYICAILERSGIAQDRRGLMNPVSENFGVNFFIKNTANMNGYIKPGGQFQNAVFGLLTDLRSNYRNSEINLHHVNMVISHKSLYDSDDALGRYIYRVNSNEFSRLGRENGGNTGSTDFDVIFGHVLETVDKDNVAILAADFIFSPGRGVRDVNDYLEKQRNSIRAKFASKINDLDLTVMALKMEADFDGNYWNRLSNNVGRLTARRPYYIWFIGSPQHLSKIAANERLFVTLTSNGFTGDRFIFESLSTERQPEFRIAASANYTFDNRNRQINVIKMPRRGETFSFSLDVNFNDAFRDSAFFADVNNYEIRNYELVINNRRPQNFRHRLTLTSERVNFGSVRIAVMGKIPDWVNDVHSTDDVNIRNNVSEQGKTYGFKHIVEGVYAAFYPNIPMNERHVLQTINLNVQRGKK